MRMSLLRPIVGLLRKPYTCTVIQKIAATCPSRTRQTELHTSCRWLSSSGSDDTTDNKSGQSETSADDTDELDFLLSKVKLPELDHGHKTIESSERPGPNDQTDGLQSKVAMSGTTDSGVGHPKSGDPDIADESIDELDFLLSNIELPKNSVDDSTDNKYNQPTKEAKIIEGVDNILSEAKKAFDEGIKLEEEKAELGIPVADQLAGQTFMREDAETEVSGNEKKNQFVFADEEWKIGNYFPTRGFKKSRVDGVKFNMLPVIHINARKQNTKGGAYLKSKAISYQSGGRVGFRNAKKKTAVCGQTVGFAIGLDMKKKGYTNARVVIKGMGEGRLPSLKGLQLAGINIVSITDDTFPNVSARPPGNRY